MLLSCFFGFNAWTRKTMQVLDEVFHEKQFNFFPKFTNFWSQVELNEKNVEKRSHFRRPRNSKVHRRRSVLRDRKKLICLGSFKKHRNGW